MILPNAESKSKRFVECRQNDHVQIVGWNGLTVKGTIQDITKTSLALSAIKVVDSNYPSWVVSSITDSGEYAIELEEIRELTVLKRSSRRHSG